MSRRPVPPEKYLTPGQFAELLQLSETTVRQHIRQGRIPSKWLLNVGGVRRTARWRIHPDAVHVYAA